MTHIILLGHGGLGPALLETAAMLMGSTDRVRALDFPPGSSLDDLTRRLSDAVDAVVADQGTPAEVHGVLVLADVAGGSPSRVALGEALAGRAEVVTGVNLPMLIDALAGAETSAPAELARRVVDAGRDGIRDLGAQTRGGGRSA